MFRFHEPLWALPLNVTVGRTLWAGDELGHFPFYAIISWLCALDTRGVGAFYDYLLALLMPDFTTPMRSNLGIILQISKAGMLTRILPAPPKSSNLCNMFLISPVLLHDPSGLHRW